MSNPAISSATPPPSAKPNFSPVQSNNSFGQNRPRRRLASAKAVIMSPEQRKILEEANRTLIDAALAEGRVTKLKAMWADGAINTQGFSAKD
jgi:hypothetical protein